VASGLIFQARGALYMYSGPSGFRLGAVLNSSSANEGSTGLAKLAEFCQATMQSVARAMRRSRKGFGKGGDASRQ
jgi:hypothetical protein